MQQPKFCEFCGAPLAPGVRFCEACGQAVPGTGTTQLSRAPYEPEPASEQTLLSTRPEIPPAPAPLPAAPAVKPLPNRPIPPPPYIPPPTPPKPRNNRPILIGILVVVLVCCLCCVVVAIASYAYLGPNRSETFETIITQVVNQIEPTQEFVQSIPEATALPEEPPQATATAEPTLEDAAPPEGVPPPASQANVSFEGVSFYLDPRIGSAASGEIVPAVSGQDLPYWEVASEYLSFSFSGYAVSGHFHTPAVLVYPVEAYTQANPDVEATFTKFKDVMDYQPVISPTDGMPFLPMWNAGQVLATQISYLKFQNGSGVRYLTQFGQDVYPINNNSLFYTFQGMTDDGKWYIAAIMPANTSVLPDPETLVQDPSFYDNYPNYLDETQMLLGALPPEVFTPDLSVLDELFKTLVVNK